MAMRTAVIASVKAGSSFLYQLACSTTSATRLFSSLSAHGATDENKAIRQGVVLAMAAALHCLLVSTPR